MAIIDSVAWLSRRVQIRGKLRLLGWMTPRSGERPTSLFGSRITLDLADDIQRWIYLGTFEPDETARIGAYLKPGMTFVDAGANIGYFSLLAASKVGETGRVVAVEPSRWVSRRLIDTVRQNRLSHVRVEEMGLSDQAGEITLYVPPPEHRNHAPSMSDYSQSGWKTEMVPVRPLDDCLDDWGIDRVDLLKVDVEGHEPAVLAGAKKAIAAGRIRALMIELNEESLKSAGSSARALYASLIDAGFRDDDDRPIGTGSIMVNRFLRYQDQA